MLEKGCFNIARGSSVLSLYFNYMFTIHEHVDLNLRGFQCVFAYKVAPYFILYWTTSTEHMSHFSVTSGLKFIYDFQLICVELQKSAMNLVGVSQIFR